MAVAIIAGTKFDHATNPHPTHFAHILAGSVTSLKIALHLEKVCYKVSLCEYCQRQSCKAFTGLSIWYEIGCQLILITNRKSDMGF